MSSEVLSARALLDQEKLERQLEKIRKNKIKKLKDKILSGSYRVKTDELVKALLLAN